MSDGSVGAYINRHFFSSYQKVGTFKIVNGQKQGGNVVAYFCLANGTVLHAIAGPVDAKQFLQEARWVIEIRKSAITEMKGDLARYGAYFKKAHADRYLEEFANGGLGSGPFNRVTQIPAQRPSLMPVQAQVHWLLATRNMPKLSDIYKTVYQDILGERVSNLPVQER